MPIAPKMPDHSDCMLEVRVMETQALQIVSIEGDEVRVNRGNAHVRATHDRWIYCVDCSEAITAAQAGIDPDWRIVNHEQ